MSASKSHLDKLGERLKNDAITEEDVRVLNDYRLSFQESYETVRSTIETELGLEPTGRPEKSTSSLSDKLKRDSIRLSQIQDIAGCRIIVEDLRTQEAVLKSLLGLYPDSLLLDRRIKPSHGYRAVHLVVNVDKRRIEVQIRTALQHVWAELCEKLADTVDKSIKYGGGDREIRELLDAFSHEVARHDEIESKVAIFDANWATLSLSDLTQNQRDDLSSARAEIEQIKTQWTKRRVALISRIKILIDKLQARS